jgi:hypothetical protein
MSFPISSFSRFRDLFDHPRRAVLVPMRPALGEQQRSPRFLLPLQEQLVRVHQIHAVLPQNPDEVVVVAAPSRPPRHIGHRRQVFRIDLRLARRDHQQERDAILRQPVLQAARGRTHVPEFLLRTGPVRL